MGSVERPWTGDRLRQHFADVFSSCQVAIALNPVLQRLAQKFSLVDRELSCADRSFPQRIGGMCETRLRTVYLISAHTPPASIQERCTERTGADHAKRDACMLSTARYWHRRGRDLRR